MKRFRLLFVVGFMAVISASSAIAATGIEAEESEDICAAVLPKQALAQCSLCHSITETPRRMAGPDLYGVFDRKAGADVAYRYSSAFIEADLVWDREMLNAFLENSRAVVPGNKMAFGGIRDAKKRKAVICALKGLRRADGPTLGDEPALLTAEDFGNEK
jgi:cytochrome c